METFIKKFKDLFDDDSIIIKSNTIFREIEDWDSIIGLSVIGMIDEEYGIEFNAGDMRLCNTIEDIYNRIQSKK